MSVINQMLKDLEQRRAQGFDEKGGILDDLAAGGLHPGRGRGVKLVLLLLTVAIVLLTWLLFDRFTHTPDKMANLSPSVQASNPAVAPVKSAVIDVPVSPSEPVQEIVPEQPPVAELAQAETVKSEPAPVSVEKEQPKPAQEALTASMQIEESEAANELPVVVPVIRIDHITPEKVMASGENTIIQIHGEGFIPPLDVLLEWSDGRGFKVLDKQQVELINEHEIHVHFNPGTRDDEWAARVQHQAGESSVRFPFTIYAPAEEIRDLARPVIKTEASSASMSKTRLTETPIVQAGNLFSRASDLLKKSQTDEAATLLRKVLTLDAGHSGARELLASLLFHNQQYSEASDILQAGIVERSGYIPFYVLLARVHMEQGQDADAIKVLESQKPLARDYSDYYALLAALYQRGARYTDAVAVYRGLLEVFPGRAIWWMGLGISLQSLDKPAEALTAYQRASRAQGLSTELKKFVQQRIRILGG